VKTQDSQVFISYLILTSTDKSITDTQRYYLFIFLYLLGIMLANLIFS